MAPLAVEALVPCPDGRWSVKAGGKELARLFADSLAQCRLQVGSLLDDRTLRRLRFLAARDAARADALRWLKARPYSRQRLAQRLRSRGYPAPAVASALALLARQGLLDDARLAQEYARARLRRRPEAPGRLAARLEQQGLSPEAAREAALLAVQAEGGLHHLARRALETLVRGWSGEVPSPRQLARWARSLERRGFSREMVRRVLAERFPEAQVGEEEP